MLLPITLFSQTPEFKKHEFCVSYGLISTERVVSVADNALTLVFTWGEIEKRNARYTGAIFLTYRYSFNDKVSFGITGGIDNEKGDYVQGHTKVGDYKRATYTTAMELKYTYSDRKVVKIYCLGGLGYTFANQKGSYTYVSGIIEGTGNENSNKGHINFQLSPVGLRIGKRLAGFVELGFGYKGIFNTGISCNF